MLAPPITSRTVNPNRNLNSFSPKASLSTNFVAPFAGGSVSADFSGHKLRPSSLNPASFPRSKGKRGVVTMVYTYAISISLSLFSIFIFFAKSSNL